MKLATEKDVKMIIKVPAYLHKKIKIMSAKTEKSMHLIIIEALKENIK